MMKQKTTYSLKQKKRFGSLVKKFTKTKILAIGDLILDEFIWGSVKRISPEAPVPVVDVKRESFMPGGNLNTAHNVRTLGGTVYPCGIIGRDLWGRMLLKKVKQEGIDVGGIMYDDDRQTTLKTRVIAHSQQVVRFDRENIQPLSPKYIKQLLRFIESKIQDVDCVIIEDYGKGVIVPKLLKQVIALASKYKKYILVDPKENHFSYYKGVTSITPNYKEALSACGISNGDTCDIHAVGVQLLKKLNLESVLITMGENGMMLVENNGDCTHIPTAAKEVFDVSGAGDTVIATFGLALAAGASLKEAAMISNIAAGVVVGKVGTASLVPDELLDAIEKA